MRVTQSVDAVQSEVRRRRPRPASASAASPCCWGSGPPGFWPGSWRGRHASWPRPRARSPPATSARGRPRTGPREEREVAAAFNEMTARLAASLEAQRDFVANASHQLRTPLTGLRLRIEAAAGIARSTEVVEELRAAELELERMTSLLTNLLALARGDERPPEGRAVSLGRVARAARRALALARRRARPGDRADLRARDRGRLGRRGSRDHSRQPDRERDQLLAAGVGDRDPLRPRRPLRPARRHRPGPGPRRRRG